MYRSTRDDVTNFLANFIELCNSYEQTEQLLLLL